MEPANKKGGFLYNRNRKRKETVNMKDRKGTNNDLSKMLTELMESYQQMIDIANQITNITSKTNILSLNSSIEAARAGQAGKGFAVIAREMQAMAGQSKEANINSKSYMEDMKNKISDVAGVRTADIAFDLIDKIDRNLFERNCDVQAWATFEVIIDFLENPTAEKQNIVVTFLNDICLLYEVYLDIILADTTGKVIAVANRQDLIGGNVAEAGWFRGVMESKKNTVSDMYHSETNGDTVAYSAPVKNKAGKIIGVLSSRFNWEFIYDIISNAKISKNGEICVINTNGIVIASKNREDIFKRSFKEEEAFKAMKEGEHYGYILHENEQGMLEGITAFAKTRGYNSYPGKDWSVIVREKF